MGKIFTWKSFRNAAAATTVFVVGGTTALYMTWEKLPGWFAGRADTCPAGQIRVDAVFTGDQSRIDEASRLLLQGKASKAMLITGNESFTLRLKDGADITFDAKAVNTWENADNTARWLASMQRESKICAVRLVDSAAHMPRSMLLLHWAIARQGLHTRIQPHSVDDNLSLFSNKIREMAKTVGTIFGFAKRGESAYVSRRLAANSPRFLQPEQ